MAYDDDVKKALESEVEANKAKMFAAQRDEDAANEDIKKDETDEAVDKEKRTYFKRAAKFAGRSAVSGAAYMGGKAKNYAPTIVNKVKSVGAGAAGAVRGAGQAAMDMGGSIFVPASGWDWLFIWGVILHLLIDGGLFHWQINYMTISLDIITAFMVVFLGWHSPVARIGAPVVLFLEAGLLPVLSQAGIAGWPVLRWFALKLPWAFWAYFALIVGNSERPSRFSSFWFKAAVIYWLFFLIFNVIIAEGLVSDLSTDVQSMVTPEMEDEFNQKATTAWQGPWELGKELWKRQSAYYDCTIKMDCTEWDRIQSGVDEEEYIVPTGEELEIVPTEVKVTLGKNNEAFTSNYVNTIGVGIDIDVIKGNDDVVMTFEAACNFSNSSTTWPGMFTPFQEVTIPFSENTMASSNKQTFLCRSREPLPPGRYTFTGFVKFNQVARSYLKMYFVSDRVPDMDSQSFPHKEVIPAKMESGIVQVDLTTKTESPMKMGSEDRELGLRIGFVNNADGKILELPSLPTIIPPDSFTIEAMPSLTDVNQMFREQQRTFKMPFFQVNLNINPSGMFSETNNPVDRIITIEAPYIYQFEKKVYIMVI